LSNCSKPRRRRFNIETWFALGACSGIVGLIVGLMVGLSLHTQQ